MTASFKKHTLKVAIQRPFGNLYRKQHVLIACQDTAGKILVGAKPNYYPPGIYRLVGGGVNEDETTQQAAVRELGEELQVQVPSTALVPLAQVFVEATSPDRTYRFQTDIYFTQLKDNDYQASDDIDDVVKLTLQELEQLAQRYDDLDDDFWYEDDNVSHSWGDYGKVYGPIHRIVHDWVKEMALPISQ